MVALVVHTSQFHATAVAVRRRHDEGQLCGRGWARQPLQRTSGVAEANPTRSPGRSQRHSVGVSASPQTCAVWSTKKEMQAHHIPLAPAPASRSWCELDALFTQQFQPTKRPKPRTQTSARKREYLQVLATQPYGHRSAGDTAASPHTRARGFKRPAAPSRTTSMCD